MRRNSKYTHSQNNVLWKLKIISAYNYNLYSKYNDPLVKIYFQIWNFMETQLCLSRGLGWLPNIELPMKFKIHAKKKKKGSQVKICYSKFYFSSLSNKALRIS